jgi:hypothetical protein
MRILWEYPHKTTKSRYFATLYAPEIIKPGSNTGYQAEGLSLEDKFFIA